MPNGIHVPPLHKMYSFCSQQLIRQSALIMGKLLQTYKELGAKNLHLVKVLAYGGRWPPSNSRQFCSIHPSAKGRAYGASKAAVVYTTNSLRVDLKQEGILVSLICPGFIKTPLTDLNYFDMPFRITTKEARAAIQVGLKKRKAEIHVPKKFTYVMKLMPWLPTPIWSNIAQKMVK